MSRPIKFRAWDVFAKEMDYEVTIDPDGKVAAFNPLDGQYIRGFSDDEKVLMQYTGLKDRNGKEIYEGDIVENSFSQRDDFCYKVIWYEEMGQWMFDPFMKGDYDAPLLGIEEFLKTWEDVGFEDETLEVIGNIYENPSLLEDTP
ncbi:YopX family protein [Paenibacillus ottowii]